MSQFVSDLAWLITGRCSTYVRCLDQSLIESDIHLSQYWLPDVAKRLDELSHCPEPLEEAIRACKSHFLGSYFETLFSFAIEHFSNLHIVSEHAQIVQNGKTLGEVDMLVETPKGELLQLEIAIKFYLERLDLYPNHWVGPNKNDSLQKKVTRARGHQLQVLNTAAGKKWLKNLNLREDFASKLLIFGRLYLALDTSNKRANLLENPLYGGWVSVSNVASFLPFFSHIMVLVKPHWLVASNMARDSHLFTAQYIDIWKNIFTKDARPQHIFLWCDVKGKASGRFIFVVPDDW